MTLADAALCCGIAYYGGGRDVQALLRTARICSRRMGPRKSKALGLLLRSGDPAAVLEGALETLQGNLNGVESMR